MWMFFRKFPIGRRRTSCSWVIRARSVCRSRYPSSKLPSQEMDVGKRPRFDRVEQWPRPQAVETAPGGIFTPQQGLSSDAAWKVLIDREGTTWVGTNSGLDRLRRNVLSKPALPPAQERQFSIAPGDRGSIWTGNSSLPLTQIAADGTLTSFSRTRETITVRRDHNGTIWSAGAGDSSTHTANRPRGTLGALGNA